MPLAVRNVRLPAGSRGEPIQPEARAYAIEEHVQKQWVRLLNVARYECGLRDPSLSRMVEWIASSILVDGWRNTIDPEIAERFARFGVDIYEEVEAGKVCCIFWARGERDPNCAGWQIGRLQYHHVLPRSRGGTSGPVVAVCEPHHQRITENRDGKTWRDYAREWGFVEEADAD